MNSRQKDHLSCVLRCIKNIIDDTSLTDEEKISLLGLIL